MAITRKCFTATIRILYPWREAIYTNKEENVDAFMQRHGWKQDNLWTGGFTTDDGIEYEIGVKYSKQYGDIHTMEQEILDIEQLIVE